MCRRVNIHTRFKGIIKSNIPPNALRTPSPAVAEDPGLPFPLRACPGSVAAGAAAGVAGDAWPGRDGGVAMAGVGVSSGTPLSMKPPPDIRVDAMCCDPPELIKRETAKAAKETWTLSGSTIMKATRALWYSTSLKTLYNLISGSALKAFVGWGRPRWVSFSFVRYALTPSKIGG